VKHVMEKLGIVVEVLTALENQEVPRHVAKKEANQHQAGDGDDELFANRGVPEEKESFAKRVHLRFLNHYAGSLQGDGSGKCEKSRLFRGGDRKSLFASPI